mmetsp:Transcript_9713/g.21904  ORF Transcript_9713/g.21904 Transcript_9713/m.21904 type:complete len:284 (+) Transcript_9713:745-1596(+)
MSCIVPFAILQQAVTLVSITLSKSADSMFSTDEGAILIPALLKRRSVLPKCAQTAFMRFWTSVSFVTSVGIVRMSISTSELSSHNAFVASNGSGLLPASTKPTRSDSPAGPLPLPSTPPQPPLANLTATARPIPLPPPVMSATTRFTLGWITGLSAFFSPKLLTCIPSAKASLKSSQYSRIISSVLGVGGAPNAKALFESTFVGNDPTILLSRSSSSYTTFPNFDTESGETTLFIASSNWLKDTDLVGRKTVLSNPNNLSTSSGIASCTAIIPPIAALYPVTA